METNLLPVQDGMQVCRNGHVITDLLHTFPERALRHCDRCGAVTVNACPTCGQEIPGAVYVPEAAPLGLRRPPDYCAACGAAYPWTQRAPHAPLPGALAGLETLLRRLPGVVRELRARQGERPPFRVEDEQDLEDLLRALLPLHGEQVCYERRTPHYATGARTDFRIGSGRSVLLGKRVTPRRREKELAMELAEDLTYYQSQGVHTLVLCIFDPERLLVEPRRLEQVWANLAEQPRVRPFIVS